jgi:class 3 adenylate cyclase
MKIGEFDRAPELTRNTDWYSTDVGYEDELSGVVFYNPREDIVPRDLIDMVVTDKGQVKPRDIATHAFSYEPTALDAVFSAVQSERVDLGVKAAPDGTITIMFTDIEDSTAKSERLGNSRWNAILQEHNNIVEEQVSNHGGYKVKSLGDGYMIVFRSALDAVRCAIAIQQRIGLFNTQGGHPYIGVRIGLHTGEPIRDVDDFIGTEVNKAARIASKAKAGDILISSVVKELISAVPDIRYDDGQEEDLRGLAGTHRLYKVLV